MPEFSSSTYSATDASNTSASPNGAPEGMNPSGVNDTVRALIGATKRFWQRIQGAGFGAGSANTYTITYSPALAAYVDGERYSFRVAADNTGAATLNINGLGATTIKKMSSAGKTDLAAGDLKSGQPATVEYDGTHFVLVTPLANLITYATAAQAKAASSSSVAMTPSASAAGGEGAWADVASASTTDLGAQDVTNLRITGTTTITAFGTIDSGVRRKLRFAGALTLTHNATSLILPGGANITTVAGDTCDAVSLGSGNWAVTNYQRIGVAPQTAGFPLQVRRTQTQSETTYSTNTQIPLDSTTPLNTEGNQLFSDSITLAAAANKVRITGQSMLAAASTQYQIAALFRGSTCIAVFYEYTGGSGEVAVAIDFEDAPGSVGPHTYSIRVGNDAGSANTYVNRISSGSRFGSLLTSHMTLTEVLG